MGLLVRRDDCRTADDAGHRRFERARRRGNQQPLKLFRVIAAPPSQQRPPTQAPGYNTLGATLVGGLLRWTDKGLYKLLVAPRSKLYLVDQDVRAGPVYPNRTGGHELAPQMYTRPCAREPRFGCLFEVLGDPTEERSLAAEEPELFKSMLAEVDELQATVYSPDRGAEDPAACATATTTYSGFWGPWTA